MYNLSKSIRLCYNIDKPYLGTNGNIGEGPTAKKPSVATSVPKISRGRVTHWMR